VAVHADVIRAPWSECLRARHQLDRLVGLPLQSTAVQMRELVDARQQCTHMLDAAVLAIAHAVRDIPRRRYDISVECVEIGAPQPVQLLMDGEPELTGVLQASGSILNMAFVEPAKLRGVSVKDLYRWAQANRHTEDQLEAMWILRRAIYIAGSRTQDLDELEFAVETNPGFGACYVYQPGIAEKARRIHGATRDFTDSTQLAGWEAVRIDTNS
jgi:hypothetical protein